MGIYDMYHKELCEIVSENLKKLGIKHRKDKKLPTIKQNSRNRIFQKPLHFLELADVVLANGCVVQVPKIVADTCNFILENVETEGIFRKAGSISRERQIKAKLEAGLPLGKSHNVIDVANVIKTFFRELPEPLIPLSIQETFLRSVIITEHQKQIKAILLTCLLLPPMSLNTLSFFMQFLRAVSLKEHLNKMSTSNLAVLLTPALMPFSAETSHRFKNHILVVRLLIENADSIGNIPNDVTEKLQAVHDLDVTQKKKKKRRSEVFNGFRKIVGSALGSLENLEYTPASLNKVMSSDALAADEQQQPPPVTPCLKSTKKRKFTEPVCAFSAKKKRDLLALLPSNSGGFLPNTPLTKDSKKSRLSLGGRRHVKGTVAVDRRWSSVGSGWLKAKSKSVDEIQSISENSECTLITDGKSDSPETKMSHQPKVKPSAAHTLSSDEMEAVVVHNEDLDLVMNVDCAKTYESEYEEIKERVEAIETCISNEFNTIRNAQDQSPCLNPLLSKDMPNTLSTELERIQDRYEQLLAENEVLCSPGTEQLAQHLSRGLRIRRSMEHRIMRSPSARKIGAIRRRSQEKTRLSRTRTWHVSSTAAKTTPSKQKATISEAQHNVFQIKSNLKRGRPNTVHTGLVQQHPDQQPDNNTSNMEISFNKNLFGDERSTRSELFGNLSEEKWTAGEIFFASAPQNDKGKQKKSCLNIEVKDFYKMPDADVHTPLKQSIPRPVNNANILTPMLPPKSVPRKHFGAKTPNSAIKRSSAVKLAPMGRSAVSTPIQEEISGRASIAMLRTQNAGMVMAKAKLFDDLGGKSSFHMEARTAKLNKVAIPNHGKSTVIEHEHPVLQSPSVPRKNFPAKSPASLKRRQHVNASIKHPGQQLADAVLSTGDASQLRKIRSKPPTRTIIRSATHPTQSPFKASSYRNSPRAGRPKGNRY